MSDTDLRVVGAGVGRTGTMSLKLALERLLGGPCYHMREVFLHPEHVPIWRQAIAGRMPDWSAFLQGYRAAVDWPSCAFWPELSRAFPGALVVLSVRDPEAWWSSAHETIFPGMERASFEWRAMATELFETRFTSRIEDREACIAAFERHNAAVRAQVPSSRLLEWRAEDGWAPLCAALGVPVPDEPFPRVNTRQDWIRARR